MIIKPVDEYNLLVEFQLVHCYVLCTEHTVIRYHIQQRALLYIAESDNLLTCLINDNITQSVGCHEA